jgi:hypothetical protein
VSSSKAEVFLGIRLVFEPNDYHCSKRVHFTAEYVFFSGFGLLLSFILVDNEEKNGKKNLLSSAGNEFFQYRTIMMLVMVMPMALVKVMPW